jgi:O-antigen/teichoic acid export membrane protein
MLILRNDIGRLASKPELAHWLLASGLIIPADVVRYVVASWYQAWQRIRIAVFVRDGFTAMLLPLLLFGVWLTGGEYFTPESAALIYATSSVLPSLVLLILHPPQLSLVQGVFSRWDISYGGKMSLTKLAAQPARQIDIVFVGFLASSGMTAEYVLASRLAQVLMMSKSFLAQLLVPRIGYRLARFETDQLVTEYNAVRGTSLFIAISAGLIIVAFPSQIMGLFGDYTQSAVLVTLVAAMLIRVGAGPSGNYLAQAGYAGWTLVNIIFGLVANAALAIWWVPKHGAMGAALSFLVAVLIQNMGTIGVAWYKDKFPALNVGTALVLVMVSALLLLNVVGQIDGWLSVLGMMVVLLIMAINGWGTISVVWRAARTRFSSNLEDSV